MPVPTRIVAYTTPVAEATEQDDTITLKRSDPRPMLLNAVNEFAKKGRGGIAL